MAKKKTSQKKTATRRRSAFEGEMRELLEYEDQHRAALGRVLEARRSAEAAFDRALFAAGDGRRMLAERKQLGDLIVSAHRAIRDGKATRKEMVAEHGKRIHAFEATYRKLAEETWLRVAESSPSAYTIYRQMREEPVPKALNVQLLYFLGYIFQYQWPVQDETASTGQALDGIPPFDATATGFSLKITQEHTDVIAFTSASATPAVGRASVFCNVGAADLIPGVGSARAMVGAEFTFPRGLTQFSVAADIDWTYELSTWCVFGGAGSGADLIIRAEPSDGSAPTERLQGLASVIAPVIWGAGAKGSGQSTISLSLTTAATLQGLKVFAGVAAHAEAEAVAGTSFAIASGTLRKITIHGE